MAKCVVYVFKIIHYVKIANVDGFNFQKNDLQKDIPS